MRHKPSLHSVFGASDEPIGELPVTNSSRLSTGYGKRSTEDGQFFMMPQRRSHRSSLSWWILFALVVAFDSSASSASAASGAHDDNAENNGGGELLRSSLRWAQEIMSPWNSNSEASSSENSTSNDNSTTSFSSNSTTTCPACPLQCEAATNTTSTASSSTTTSEQQQKQDEPLLVLQILVVDSQGIVDMVAWNARDYVQHHPETIKIEIKKAPTMPALFAEIENDAKSGGGLFDAYYTNPTILGSAAVTGAFLDLTPHVKASPHADWTDVLLALRTHVTTFEDKIYIILLDGDTHTMFYRKDVLEAFGLKPPRTWNEYNEVAAAVHGKVFNGTRMSGSCFSRIPGDHAMYWSHLILSSITQTQGTASGSLFDTKDMAPLIATGEAFAEMLRLQEEQAKYGTPDEFDKEINHVQNAHMNDGSCLMTMMWGDMFRRSKSEGSILHDKLGIAPTPGSEFVLNRKTGKLERCNKELCPYAKYYDDLGFVNSAPYAANGGWGAAISANTSPEKQKALADFFLWASSKEQAQRYVIPNATLPWYEINGQDPWRKSQLDVDKWVERGFNRDLSKMYVDSILSNLVSKNVVVEARFPKAGEIMSVLDEEVYQYLVRAVVNQNFSDLTESERHNERLKVAQTVTDQWNQIIKAYNARGDTIAPILEIYQRLRGVHVPDEERHYLTQIRPVGLTLMAIIMASSLGAVVWVGLKRKTSVVRASQPPFLGLICLGCFVMSTSIYTMGIDDSVASTDGCSMACTATVWLFSLGFVTTFSALFSKIWRLNRLFRSARNFRRVQIHATDVLLPFTILLVLNVALLLTWTLADPLYWERVEKGRTTSGALESYGHCTSDGTISIIMMSLIASVNGLAVILANVQAYQTRNIALAYNESKYIAIAMGLILQSLLIGLPVLLLSDSNPTTRYLVRSALVFIVCMSTLGFIFVPKMLYKKNAVNSERSSTIVSHSRSYWQPGASAAIGGGISQSFTQGRDKSSQPNSPSGSRAAVSQSLPPSHASSHLNPPIREESASP